VKQDLEKLAKFQAENMQCLVKMQQRFKELFDEKLEALPSIGRT
jgi:hypothetical protein